MAREVKATAYTNRHYPDRTTYTFGPEQLEAFADLVRADEREACAKKAETLGVHPALNVFAGGPDWYKHGKEIAAAIRARGQG